MSTDHTRNRVAKGISTGGQYAVEHRPEAAVSLGAPTERESSRLFREATDVEARIWELQRQADELHFDGLKAAARDATMNQRASVIRATRSIIVHRNTDQELLTRIAREHPHGPTRQLAQQRLDPLLAARRSAIESQQAAAEDEFRRTMAFLRGQ
ncbi:hypothetical protein D477_000635 [Arthrobacter crystallopoietes BAB-32]|uniref:Uncharacterized protein n=1 Tax=Arthrobacter crystallopoietes BAB-32 TaxID=1246476 RepID=N1V814_9MICC|nr:hypothetical protein [Arthrobacter crystallopoietes]EMY36144.1 hypothetical protein D477_000635 [Arthrobacter crystallopoietes BAB-32]